MKPYLISKAIWSDQSRIRVGSGRVELLFYWPGSIRSPKLPPLVFTIFIFIFLYFFPKFLRIKHSIKIEGEVYEKIEALFLECIKRHEKRKIERAVNSKGIQ